MNDAMRYISLAIQITRRCRTQYLTGEAAAIKVSRSRDSGEKSLQYHLPELRDKQSSQRKTMKKFLVFFTQDLVIYCLFGTGMETTIFCSKQGKQSRWQRD